MQDCKNTMKFWLLKAGNKNELKDKFLTNFKVGNECMCAWEILWCNQTEYFSNTKTLTNLPMTDIHSSLPSDCGQVWFETCLTSQRLVSNLCEIFISVAPAYVFQWEGSEVWRDCLGKRWCLSSKAGFFYQLAHDQAARVQLVIGSRVSTSRLNQKRSIKKMRLKESNTQIISREDVNHLCLHCREKCELIFICGFWLFAVIMRSTGSPKESCQTF